MDAPLLPGSSRLVVVSNRLADPRRTGAGGLAVALGEALARSGGLWFGWSGQVVPRAKAPARRRACSAPAT